MWTLLTFFYFYFPILPPSPHPLLLQRSPVLWRMCDDLHCQGAKLPAPDATKAKKVIKFERIEALPQTMWQCPWGGIYVCGCWMGGGGEVHRVHRVGVRKAINIQGLGEREERGQRGTEDGIRSLFASPSFSVAAWFARSFALFISLLFIFSSISLTAGMNPLFLPQHHSYPYEIAPFCFILRPFIGWVSVLVKWGVPPSTNLQPRTQFQTSLWLSACSVFRLKHPRKVWQVYKASWLDTTWEH